MKISARPTRKSLTRLFGFPVPSAFVSLVAAFWEVAQETGHSVSDLFDKLCGLDLDGKSCRYQETPPELFPIGRLGVDGVHYGYVIHAPEETADDHPLGDLCPMDPEGVLLLGNTTREAIEALLSEWESDPDDAEQLQESTALVGRLSLKLGCPLSPDRTGRRHGKDGNGLPVKPYVRPGDRHVMTTDGVGVVAPKRLFRSRKALPEDFEEWGIARVLRVAKTDLEDGYPATALIHLREGYWHHWTEDGAILRYGTQMRSVYEALGRPLLAKVVLDRLKKFA